MKLNPKAVGFRIMMKRKEQGLNQSDLAQQLNISKNHLSEMERGVKIPTTKMIINICNTLGGTPDFYLIGRISEDDESELMQTVKELPEPSQKMLLKLLKLYIEETYPI